MSRQSRASAQIPHRDTLSSPLLAPLPTTSALSTHATTPSDRAIALLDIDMESLYTETG